MSYRRLFGVDSFPLRDYELIKMLAEAQRKKLNTLEIRTKKGKIVKIKVSDLYPEGIMHGHYKMYKGDW